MFVCNVCKVCSQECVQTQGFLGSISQKIIKERIIDYFKTEEEGEKCIEFIYAKQETITVDSIKRTRQKSDKMDNIYKKNHPFYKK